MTPATYEDVLYSFTRRKVGNALGLEYAIRASEEMCPGETDALKGMDAEIRDFWIGLGARREEIDPEALMEYAWDTIQLGLPLARRHGRLFHSDLVRIIDEGLLQVRERFWPRLRRVEVPASKYFRIFDLLNGNDIETMIRDVEAMLKSARNYKANDDIPTKEFRFGMREPIHLNPAVRFGCGTRGQRPFLALEVDLEGHLDVASWKRQIGEFQKQLNEFQYQFAVTREGILGREVVDEFRRALIQEFLTLENKGAQSEYSVRVWTGFRSVLTGLYCRDLHKRGGLKLDDAVTKSLRFYPPRGPDDPTGEENMRANYKKASTRIGRARVRFTR